MPLLKRRVFEKSTSYQSLKDDEEVFHCEITDEIFKDYEEYCERIILVNSMVWSCEMTGKPNLTYAEALESEKISRKTLRDFPLELRVPMIYLASITKRCTFAEMSDDVFNFVRDKYFVGETVEACLNGDSWREAHVLSVTAPKRLSNSFVDNSQSPNKVSSLYTYEVEQFNDEHNDHGQIAIISHDRVRRSRGVFTREKNKLYLKQFVEQGLGGVIKIKDSILEKYNINKVRFDQIFVGNPPEFPSSKKFDKLFGNGSFLNGLNKSGSEKKSRQETMSKYVTKYDDSKQMNGKMNGNWKSKSNNMGDGKSLKDEMLRMGIAMKKKKDEETLKKKEKSLLLAAYIKQWRKNKDDLELEDHKPLPKSIPIEIPGLPNKYFGDFVSMLEFFIEFFKPLKVKDFFLHGIDFESLKRALTTKEVAGPLSDIVQMLLSSLFSLQEDEAEEYKNSNKINFDENIREDSDNNGAMSLTRGVQLATVASVWPHKYLSTPLSQLPMDSLTVSEVLRLHLLSSGGIASDHCAKWRYQQRGGYNSEDDPGLLLKIKYPHIIKALSKKHLTQLPLSYKIKIINCLISQILTYATIRDVIEENLDKSKTLKNEIRALQIAERKRETDYLIARAKIRKDAMIKKEQEKPIGEALKDLEASVMRNLENLKRDAEIKKMGFEKKYRMLTSDSFSYQSCLGYDRGYRRYWVYESIQGLFVEHATELSGVCLDKPVLPIPALATGPPEDAMSYIERMFENELNGGNSDKENDSNNGSPKKNQSEGHDRSSTGSMSDTASIQIQNLFMCTADESNCPVHFSPYPKTEWSFISSAEDFNTLVDSLNKRGIRESELKHLLEQEKEQLSKYVEKCPTTSLNPDKYPSVGKSEVQSRLARKYVDANLRYPPNMETSEILEMTLRDTVLDFEEKLHLSGLGELNVKNRDTWRSTLLNRGYDKQCQILTWGPTLNEEEENNKNYKNSNPSISSYRDPGSYLNVSDEINSDVEEDLLEETGSVDLTAVKSLASALLQLGQAVFHKHLKRPLGYDEKERSKDNTKPLLYDALKRWELSLMECTSFAQINLHLTILENSIVWSRSILNANCRICRKRNDDENMLLCDMCNKGHHIYCLKPKLTKIPSGDWFCNQCKPKEKLPQKKNRKLFTEVDSGDEDEDSSNSWNNSYVRLCTSCKSGGVLVHCNECDRAWHSECLPRPQQRKSAFTCHHCSKQTKQDKEWDPRVRRCAADAMNNIDHYKKMLKHSPRQYSDSESSEEPLILKSKRNRTSKAPSPEIEESKNSSKRRSRRSVPTTNGTNYNSENSDEPVISLRSRVSKERGNDYVNENSSKKSTRSSDAKRQSVPTSNGFPNAVNRKTRRSEVIHKSALEEVLNEMMHHKDSWPFNAPVTVEEVPDYFDIIAEPMDFETMKTKLKNGDYTNDTEFMLDVGLVFNNCYKYNQDDDVVAKAGNRLQKFFEKKCKDLNLIYTEVESEEPAIKKHKVEN